ncbi:MAG: zinc finger domain-containing protein [Candidatus Thermoplasmatota archaeon]|nr:zinc finger domain-containing protein [Candidatus Thermoplasmatota archaeon]
MSYIYLSFFSLCPIKDRDKNINQRDNLKYLKNTSLCMSRGVCSSCGTPLVERKDAVFLCPSCGKTLVGRCYRCRDKSVPYVCPECGFRGP